MPFRSRAEALNGELRELARCIEPLYPPLARVGADLRVARAREVAELRHVPEHQPLRTIEPREHVDAGANRAWVGFVGVVDQPRAAARSLQLQTPLYGAHRSKAGAHVLEARAGGHRRRGGGERVRDVVAS